MHREASCTDRPQFGRYLFSTLDLAWDCRNTSNIVKIARSTGAEYEVRGLKSYFPKVLR
jgi:hypothetical protein